MKPHRKTLLVASSAAITFILASLSTQAATFYWDGNTSTAGFGTAGGTWSSQSVTSGAGRWVSSATGIVSGSASQTTSTADTFNYGTATVGLASGTITIRGTSGTPINVGSITFGAASGAITLNGGFLAFGATKSITVNNTTNTISSVIQGSNGFTKNGSGELVLTGNLTHSGLTTVTNNGALTLSGNNSSMSGGISLSSNTSVSPRLNINSATAIGTGTLLFGGGGASDTVRIDNTSGGAITVSTNNTLTLNRNFTFVGTQSLNLGTGATTLGGLSDNTQRSITVTANTLTLGGNIGEGAALGLGIVKSGAGTLVLGGANTFSGVTTVNNSGGTLRITNASALGSGNVFIGTTASNTGTLELSLTGTNSIANNFSTNSASILTTVGANAHILNTSGTNTISGDLTVTNTGGNGLNVVSNGGLLTLSGTITHTVASGRTLSLGGGGNGVVSGAINNNTVDSQPLALNKSGAGTWTLSNASNGYTGATTVAGGALVVNGNISTSNLTTVQTGGTIGGSGTVGALTVQNGGTLAPGTSPGTLNTGTLSLANLSNLNFELTPADFTVGGGINDLVSVTGNLALDGILNLTPTSGDFLSATIGNAWRLFDYTGTLTDNTLEFGSMPSLGSGLDWDIDTSTTGQVNLTVIPEPSTALLGALGGILLLRRRR